MALEAKIISTGTWKKIQIVSVTQDFSQTLENGKWVNTTVEPQRFEDEILTFGKYFRDNAEAEKFMDTKIFKSTFKSIQKNLV
jgi:hypothetical protein